MWTRENRGLYERKGVRYPSDLSDAEWMLIAPMILLSITAGVARMGDARRLGTLGARTVSLYLLTMALAVATGLLLVNLVRPGRGGSLRETEFFQTAVGDAPPAVATEGRLGEFLLDSLYAVLQNPFASLAGGVMLTGSLAALGPASLALHDRLSRTIVRRQLTRRAGWTTATIPTRGSSC